MFWQGFDKTKSRLGVDYRPPPTSTRVLYSSNNYTTLNPLGMQHTNDHDQPAPFSNGGRTKMASDEPAASGSVGTTAAKTKSGTKATGAPLSLSPKAP